MKSTLIGWAIQGCGSYYNDKVIMENDEEQFAFYEGFQTVLRKILPKSLGFKEFEIRNMEVVFICNDGEDEFLLETASGGITALIDIVWQIYMYSTKEGNDFTVIIDEIENHLHPSMQRQILPDLLNAFPDVHFIVSTHSPLVVGAVKDSNVYVLKYNDNGKIESQPLDFKNKAKSATQILNEVLGVPFTMPIWAEEQLNEIVSKYSNRKISENDLHNLKNELTSSGLDYFVPEAIGKVVEEQK